MTTQVLLDVRGLRVAFAGQPVVHGIGLQVAAGEKLALVGESGSGKTVSALSLLRLVPDAEVEGQAWLRDEGAAGREGRGRDLLSLSERELRGVRGDDIAVIFQEPMTALNPLYTVGDQIAEVVQLKKGSNRAEAWQRAVQLLADTGIPEPERRAQAFPHQLSGGQRQRAMIAMALAGEPRLLLADEPTTALDVTVRQQILDLLVELQSRTGMAVLVITHDLNLVRRFAERVVVMERGHVVEHGPVGEVFANPQHEYTRKLLDSIPVRDVVEAPALPEEPILRTRQLSVSYPVPLAGVKGWFRKGRFEAVKSVSVELPRSRTLGVIGESGSGKSTLALAALGLLPAEGLLEVDGARWHYSQRQDRPLRRVMQVVFQDPFSSLSPRMTVEELVGEGLSVHAPLLDENARREKVIAALADVGLTETQFPGLLMRYPHEFSGGQRQRLAIARALIVEPQLLVLDEPTSALDVTIQKQVLVLLQRLQRDRGLAYLLITHDVQVIRAMAHHVIVMKDGQVLEQGSAAELLTQPQHPYTRTLMAAAT